MALSGTNRGTATHSTSTSSWGITVPNNFTDGSFAVLCLAMDNTGGGGAAQSVSVTDNAGNTWTSRQIALYDPGTASSGVLVRVFTAPIASLATSDTVTVTLGNATTAKVATFTEIASDAAGGYVEYVTGNVNTGAATASPTVTTTSVTAGNVIVGTGGAESSNTWAGDADTTNGTWSTHQSTVAGSGATGMSITSQFKVTTGPGTQTYNPTLTSADVILAWIELKESIGGSSDPFGRMGFFGM